MVVINLNEPPSLLRNDVSGDLNWIKVLLVGTKSNRSAIGSRVLAHTVGGSRRRQSWRSQAFIPSTIAGYTSVWGTARTQISRFTGRTGWSNDSKASLQINL